MSPTDGDLQPCGVSVPNVRISDPDSVFSALQITRSQYLGAGASVNHLTLRVDVAGEHVVVGVVWACAIGLIGALLPAVRVARKSIGQSLQVA